MLIQKEDEPEFPNPIAKKCLNVSSFSINNDINTIKNKKIMEESSPVKPEEHKDINDVFEDILFSEEKIMKESYAEGFKIGASQDNIESYHLGYHRGAEIGAEIGYYTGFVTTYLNHLKSTEKEEKHIRSLEKLVKLLEEFPRTNSPDVDIIELLETIRVTFKKVCAQIKVHAPFPEANKSNF